MPERSSDIIRRDVNIETAMIGLGTIGTCESATSFDNFGDLVTAKNSPI